MPSPISQQDLSTIRKVAKWRFRFFCRLFWSPAWFDDDFHGPLCDWVQDTPTKDKLIVLPRSHLKTTIIGTLYPLWRAVLNPDIRILIVSNTKTNAGMTIKTIRGIIDGNPLFRACFPEVLPSNYSGEAARRNKWNDESANLFRPSGMQLPESTFEAIGIGGNIIRRHYDLQIEDDTVAPKKDEMKGEELLPSMDEIQKAIQFHKTLLPLMVDLNTGSRIVIGTRWASYDLINHVYTMELTDAEEERLGRERDPAKRGSGRFSVWDKPACDPDFTNVAYKRNSVEIMRELAGSMGPYLFAALYRNDPLSLAHMTFKPEWVRYYDEGKAPVEDGMVIVCLDPADPPTGDPGQDYSALSACCHHESGLYVLEIDFGRYTEGTLIGKAVNMCQRWGATKLRVESNRYPHLAAGFRIEFAQRNHYIAVDEFKSGGRKEARILRLVPVMENGRLFMLSGMNELETQLQQFPRGKHDDLIDSLSMHVDDLFRVERVLGESEKPKALPPNTIAFKDIVRSMNPPNRGRLPFKRQLGVVDERRWA